MEFVNAFKNIPAAVVSDSQVRSGAMDAGIRALDAAMTVVGRALTCACAPGDNLMLHKAVAQAQPGDVLVVSATMDCSMLGELMALCCQKRGVAGLVIDGCVRDSLDLIRMGFPVFCRGTHPKAPRRQIRGTLGCPVLCGGVTVCTGDLVVADADGVVAVRAGEEAEVLEKATAKLAREGELRAQLEAGRTTWELFGLGE